VIGFTASLDRAPQDEGKGREDYSRLGPGIGSKKQHEKPGRPLQVTCPAARVNPYVGLGAGGYSGDQPSATPPPGVSLPALGTR
jgi:hypothetical protein